MADRTNRSYKLDLIARDDCIGGMFPPLDPVDAQPLDLVAFHEIKSTRRNSSRLGVHFFIDDYQFERVWNQPARYFSLLAEFECVFTPDFSTYTDMPIPMQLWNAYRSRALGRIWQSLGLTVVPTLQWSTPDATPALLYGLPTGGTVAVSTIGVRRDPEAVNDWRDGMSVALNMVHPSRVIHYGPRIFNDWGATEVVYYTNPVIDRMERTRADRKSSDNRRQPALDNEWT